jgi:DNA-binding transcriptional LysR family regulator
MTLTQLSAFILVARLGSVTAAAKALGVTEPAVSQALSALRAQHGDKLIERGAGGMTLTPGGGRLLPIASQMVALGAEADAVVRAAKGVAEQLRLVVTDEFAEFVANPLLDVFSKRAGDSIEASSGVAASAEMPVLVANRLADVAIGPKLVSDTAHELNSEPIFRCSLVAVGSRRFQCRGSPAKWPWLAGPSATDPGSDASRLLARLHVPENAIQVFPNHTAAWAAAASGAGVAVAVEHLVAHQLQRRELTIVPTPATPTAICWHASTLPRERRPTATVSLLHFLSTPQAMHVMRSPGAGVPPARFRPPVHVTIWS